VILGLAALAELVGELRRKGKKVAHARGAFDLLQRSGIARLEIARTQADAMVVTIALHGDGAFPAPVLDAKLRAEVVASLPFVTAVAIEEGPSAEACIAQVGADLVVADAEGPPSEASIPVDLPSEHHVLDASVRKEVVYSKREPFSPEADAFLRRFRSRYTATDVIRALEALRPLRALVVGDAIIDEYHFVRPYGMPLKAPIIAAQLLDVEAYAGGILAVANHIAGFCGEVHLVTALGGDDTREAFIRRSLRGNVDPKFFVRPGVPTTAKRRYLRRFLLQKLFEVGVFDDRPLSEELDVELAEYLGRVLPKYDLVVVADFGHGLLSDRSIEAIAASPTFLSLNTQLNSINYGYHVLTKWPRADYACIDEEETRMACRDRLGPVEELLGRLASTLGCRTMTVTRGHHGSMTYSRDQGAPVVVPILSRQVIDTIGAGDAYLAITAPCVRMGYPPELVGFIGNAVGALAVRIVGNESPVGPEELVEFVHVLMR
jgi:bifunctional ADP-heptose synthase (sugar kinase/adenylyltransferase)